MKSWKTTAAGVCAILAALVEVTQAAISGNFATVNFAGVIAAVVAGFGLIFAKDAKVTGGTLPSTPEAVDRVAKDTPVPLSPAGSSTRQAQ
jgi:hypothetical protein